MSRQDIITEVSLHLLNRVSEDVKTDIMLCSVNELFKYHFSLGVIIRQEYLPLYNWHGDSINIVHDILLDMSTRLKN